MGERQRRRSGVNCPTTTCPPDDLPFSGARGPIVSALLEYDFSTTKPATSSPSRGTIRPSSPTPLTQRRKERVSPGSLKQCGAVAQGGPLGLAWGGTSRRAGQQSRVREDQKLVR